VAGRKRRVPGLRREEVAAPAGLSIAYYIRLERGALTNASDSVLNAIARALRLDATEQVVAGFAFLARCPGREEGQVVVGSRPRLGGVDDQRQARFGGQLQKVVAEIERAHDRGLELLGAAAVDAHVVAARRQPSVRSMLGTSARRVGSVSR
jgi:transcriptional regulator with XRE-family HTH domain